MIGSTLRLSTTNCRCFIRQTRTCAQPLRHYLQPRESPVKPPSSFTSATNSAFSLRNVAALHTSAYRTQKHEHSETSKDVVEETAGAEAGGQQLTQRQRLKKVFAEYGTTGVVFHISISLTSLGICYAAVKSGVDVQAALQKIGISRSFTDSSVATEASTFVVAYACHKVFAPLRMFMTITCTPLIVRKLRKVGILKQPLKQ